MTEEGVSEAPREGEPEVPFADGVLDDLLPGDLDWRRLVRSYPVPALVASGVAGFFLGSRHGAEILSALSGFATREVDRNISSFLGDDAVR